MRHMEYFRSLNDRDRLTRSILVLGASMLFSLANSICQKIYLSEDTMLWTWISRRIENEPYFTTYAIRYTKRSRICTVMKSIASVCLCVCLPAIYFYTQIWCIIRENRLFFSSLSIHYLGVLSILNPLHQI